MGPAARRRLTPAALVALAALAALAACPPVGPREVTGGKRTAPEPKSVLQLLAEPAAPRIVVAERSGQGSRLVLVDESGATIRPLTDDPVDGSIDLTPAWSPDGRWILFTSSRGRSSTSELSLWIVPVFAEGGARRLTDPPTVDMTPVWGVDGRIAWASTRGGAGFDVWIAELDDDAGAPRLEKLRRVTRHEDEDTMPAPGWGLFTWVRHHEGVPTLMAWHEELDQESTLLSDASTSWPAFSHDGKQLAMVARHTRGDTDLFVLTGGAKSARLYVDSSLGDETAPRFSAADRFLFATSVARTDKGQALWSSIVFVDLTEDPPKLRALYDKDPLPRLGVDVAPVPLDAGALLQAPDYRDGLKKVLGAFGLEPE